MAHFAAGCRMTGDRRIYAMGVGTISQTWSAPIGRIAFQSSGMHPAASTSPSRRNWQGPVACRP